MTLFDILKDIIYAKKGDLNESPLFNKAYSNYMIVRYLSMRNEYVKYAQFANKYGSVMNNGEIYKLLVRVVPKSNSPYIKYIKGKKEEKTNEEHDLAVCTQ